MSRLVPDHLFEMLVDVLDAAEIECDASSSPSAPAVAESCRDARDHLLELAVERPVSERGAG